MHSNVEIVCPSPLHQPPFQQYYEVAQSRSVWNGDVITTARAWSTDLPATMAKSKTAAVRSPSCGILSSVAVLVLVCFLTSDYFLFQSCETLEDGTPNILQKMGNCFMQLQVLGFTAQLVQGYKTHILACSNPTITITSLAKSSLVPSPFNKTKNRPARKVWANDVHNSIVKEFHSE